jgi:outer membrane protein OmpA-like peptidoglycan-associated protein
MGVNIELALREAAESEERGEAALLASLHDAKVSAESQIETEEAIPASVSASVSPPLAAADSPSGPAVILKGFGRNQSTPQDFHLALVRRVARFVVAYAGDPSVVRGIRIVGHADRSAASQSGPVLGERRALAVLHALQPEIERLWPGLIERIEFTTMSVGAPRSVSDDRSPDARALNRRVEVFLSFGPPAVAVEYPALALQPRPKKSSWSVFRTAPVVPHAKAQPPGPSAPAALPASGPRPLGDHLRAALPGGYLRVAPTADPPHRWICSLRADWEHAEAFPFAETGVLMSPRHVLTTGHFLLTQEINKSQSEKAASRFAIARMPRKTVAVRVIPGGIGESSQPFDAARVARAASHRTNQQWVASLATNHEFDYGLITLDAPFAANPGFWGGAGYRIGTLSDHALQNAVVHTAGYSAGECPRALAATLTRDAGANDSQSQWSTIGVVSSVAPRTFQHDMPTSKLQVGSPIWTDDHLNRVLVGICSASDRQALRITADMLKQIRAWVKQDGIQPSF